MGVLIAWPFLALLPALAFLLLYRASWERLPRAATITWLAYTAYEYGMKFRWLCSGECNIRVDLLLIYPALLILSVLAGVAGRRTILRRRSLRP